MRLVIYEGKTGWKEGEWVDFQKPIDLVDVYEDSVYKSLIEKLPSCSLNFDFSIEKGDPSNLKIPCMIGHKFIANAHIDLDLPMNVMSLAYYNAIRNDGYEYKGQNFVGIRKDMHVFVDNMSHVMDFTILENVEANIEPRIQRLDDFGKLDRITQGKYDDDAEKKEDEGEYGEEDNDNVEEEEEPDEYTKEGLEVELEFQGTIVMTLLHHND
ncbi:hypothetical protein Tco_0490285 [Tanacetum coccineum]